MIAIDKEALLMTAQQLESRMIEPTVIAREIRALAEAAKPPDDHELASKLYAALANFPCQCIETGSWPRFKADVKAHPERTCARHKAMRAWETANNLPERP